LKHHRSQRYLLSASMVSFTKKRKGAITANMETTVTRVASVPMFATSVWIATYRSCSHNHQNVCLLYCRSNFSFLVQPHLFVSTICMICRHGADKQMQLH